jgi:prepilin-type N-terminal cleavage/methylation domain-containing protein
MRKTNKKRYGQAIGSQGFTLIELLVTIAIIGLLSTIVLVSFGPVRNQAKDSAIKANMNQMRLATEIFYVNNDTYVSSNTGSDFNAARDAVNDSSPDTAVSACNATRYCMSAQMAANASNHWCIDATGAIGEGTDVCNPTSFICE